MMDYTHFFCVYYGISSFMGYYKFICVKDCMNVAPISTFKYRDSIYRVRKWIEKEIENMDNVYEYK